MGWMERDCTADRPYHNAGVDREPSDRRSGLQIGGTMDRVWTWSAGDNGRLEAGPASPAGKIAEDLAHFADGKGGVLHLRCKGGLEGCRLL